MREERGVGVEGENKGQEEEGEGGREGARREKR